MVLLAVLAVAAHALRKLRLDYIFTFVASLFPF